MNITRSEQILVIILATALAILLLLSIFAAIKIIQILSDIKKITHKTNEMADKAESMIESVQTASASIKIIQLLSSILTKTERKK
jgi:hypothetical protein